MVASFQSQDDSVTYNQYIADIAKYPLITKEEEKILLEEISKGNKAALDKLATANLKFVINVAFMYRGQGLNLTELINEGNLGLLEAARRFDKNQNIKFISYAVWWIRQSITRAIAEKGRLVRISAEKELVLRRFNKKAKSYKQVVGGEIIMDTEQIANETDYDEKQVESILKMGLKHSSLNAPIGDDQSGTVMDVIESNDEQPDILAEQNSRKEMMQKLLKELPPQERKVISLYFGLEESFSLNLKEIGKIIGLSKERVRQVKERALALLRESSFSKELSMAI